MTDSTPARKSGRQRVPNKKYPNDAFDALNLALSSDSEDEEILQQHLLLQDDSSDEFPSDAAVDEPEEEEEEEDEESVAADASDGSDVATPVEEYEDAHSYASSDPGSQGVPIAAKPTAKRQFVPRDPNMHSRGMPDNPLKDDNTRSNVKLFSGEVEEDILHVVRARDQWAVDPTLPKRSSLCHGISHTEEKRKMEATVGWDWYYDQGGREAFSKRQKTQSLTPNQALPYSMSRSNDNDFLMGPYGRQKKFCVPPYQALEIDRLWNTCEDAAPRPKRRKHGWMLDVGLRVRCMDWVPNQDGPSQYLAIAIVQTKGATPGEPPGFTPSPGPAAIQIWEFPNARQCETSQMPALHTLLCTEWGDANQIKWCPVPRKFRDTATTSGDSPSSTKPVGLLAVIFSNGIAQVLDVVIEQTERITTTAQAQKYDSAAFEVHPPPGSLSTCLTWLSASDLAIGYSNGHLAIYDICPDITPSPPSPPSPHEPHISPPPSPQEPPHPTPWLSLPLHATYIISLNSAYPSHPSLLLSSSLSGHLRLTSLSAPKTDYVFSARTRAPPSSLAYCDSLFSAVGAEDSSQSIKVWGLRCFFVNFTCGKLPSPPGPGNGIIDVGKCHTTIATGCTDGSVIVTNPMRKLLAKKHPGYQQCVFKHEFQPTSPTPTPTTTNQTKPSNHHPRRPGLSRITEGYKGGIVELGTRSTHTKVKDSVPTTTIYEEETAVTALAWNPNLCVGGWLAVGWGSGLVRVQDLALD